MNVLIIGNEYKKNNNKLLEYLNYKKFRLFYNNKFIKEDQEMYGLLIFYNLNNDIESFSPNGIICKRLFGKYDMYEKNGELWVLEIGMTILLKSEEEVYKLDEMLNKYKKYNK